MDNGTLESLKLIISIADSIGTVGVMGILTYLLVSGKLLSRSVYRELVTKAHEAIVDAIVEGVSTSVAHILQDWKRDTHSANERG